MLKTSKQLLVLVAISENPVVNWGCQQIKVVMYNGCKTVA